VWIDEIKSLTWKNAVVFFTINQVAIRTNIQNLFTHTLNEKHFNSLNTKKILFLNSNCLGYKMSF
jgi:hypothetical protein